MSKLVWLLFVVGTLATPASADRVSQHLALDASMGYATSDFEDYTPALGVDAGVGGRINSYAGIGIRGAAFLRGEEQMWFGGPSLELRVARTSLSFAVGRASRRALHTYATNTDPWMFGTEMDTESGTGMHVRIAQVIERGIGLELSAELMTVELEYFEIDYSYKARHTVASASLGYRFF
jgi:hypothetical protein